MTQCLAHGLREDAAPDQGRSGTHVEVMEI